MYVHFVIKLFESPRRRRLFLFRSIVLLARCVCLRRLAASRLSSALILTMVQLLGTG